MSLRPRIWTSCRRVATRARALGFELRLGLALALTLAAVLGLGYVSTARVLTDELIERDAQHHAADARSLEAVYNASTSGATALRELDEALDMIARRPGVVEIALVNGEGAIVDATDEGA